MKLEPIVQSLLDTDLYKFNMDQVIFHQHTDLTGEYHFKCRNKDIRFTKEMLEEIDEQIDYLCTLYFKKDELDYLRSIRFIKNDYVEFLRLYHPIRDYVTTSRLSSEGLCSLLCSLKSIFLKSFPRFISVSNMIIRILFKALS